MTDTTNANWKRNAALFIGGQAVTLIGSMVVQFAIFWHITLETKSGTMMMVFTVVALLPMFLISPFGGVWADRYNRKLVINIADGIIALVSLAVAVSLMVGREHFGILLACSAIRALGQGVQMPAAGALIPQIVPASHLAKVNGIQGSVMAFCQLASPMLGGALMMFMPLETIFLLDVATATIGISILQFFVFVPNVKKNATVGIDDSVLVNTANDVIDPNTNPNINTNTDNTKRTGYFHELRDGLRYIRGHGFVLRLVIFLVVYSILISPCAFLTPLQVARNFGGDVWRLTAIEIAFSAGMIAGGALFAAWGGFGFKNRIFTVALSCFINGIGIAFLGVTRNFLIYVAIMALGGILVTHIYTPIKTIVQSSVEDKYLGRVMSVFTMAESSMMPLAMLMFGPIADRVSIDIILVVTGGAIFLLSFALLASKTFRRGAAARG